MPGHLHEKQRALRIEAHAEGADELGLIGTAAVAIGPTPGNQSELPRPPLRFAEIDSVASAFDDAAVIPFDSAAMLRLLPDAICLVQRPGKKVPIPAAKSRRAT